MRLDFRNGCPDCALDCALVRSEVGLLKPTYYGSNGYRYCEEEGFLTLQRILFFKELRKELRLGLKGVRHTLGRGDFDGGVALSFHCHVMEENLSKTKKRIETIDKTIQYLKGKGKDDQIYFGFNEKKRAEYGEYLIHRCGDEVGGSIKERWVREMLKRVG